MPLQWLLTQEMKIRVLAARGEGEVGVNFITQRLLSKSILFLERMGDVKISDKASYSIQQVLKGSSYPKNCWISVILCIDLVVTGDEQILVKDKLTAATSEQLKCDMDSDKFHQKSHFSKCTHCKMQKRCSNNPFTFFMFIGLKMYNEAY